MSDGRRWDVFLAYASPDRDRARVLYQVLAAAGLSVCFDEAVLRPGDNWHRMLAEHLRASAVVVVLVSSHTQEAHYENEEVVMAIDQVRREGARLAPVLLHDGAQLPYGTGALHAIEYFDSAATARVTEALVDVVRNPSGGAVVKGTQVWCGRIPALPMVFAGRDVLLESLGPAVAGGKGTVLTQTIQGMGGVGKTTLAVALAAAHRHRLDVVWWVRAEQPAVLVADLAELAPRVGVAVDDDPAVTATAVREWLETTGRPWLVIFDNAPDEASLERWLPRRGVGATVLTSRNRNMGRLGEVVTIGTFPAAVAESFLRDRLAERNPLAAAEDLSAVLERLVGLPLALEQAAAWVERVPNRRFSHYVDLFDSVSGEPFPDGTRPLGYEHTAATAWRVSIDAANAEAPCAARLLGVLGFLGPDDLPCGWVRALAEAGDAYLDATEAAVDAGFAVLHGYSLAEVSGSDTVGVHRVVQAAARRSAAAGAAGCAIALLRAQANGDARIPLRWPVLAAMVPHALAALTTAGAAFADHADDLWWVLNNLTTYHRSRGDPAQAIDTGTMAVDFATTHLGREHPNTLTARFNLAMSYRSAGRTAKAIAIGEQVLAERERLLGPDHPDTLEARGNLASSSYWSGRTAEAIAIGEQVVADYERLLGPDHPGTLTARGNLASSYWSAGRTAEAIAIGEQVLADHERLLGPDHPNTLTARGNLASSYWSAGRTNEAIAIGEQVVADYERLLGPDHPDTLTARANLAPSYSSAGRTAEAIAIGEQVLADRERLLGPDHPDTLTARANLASSYWSAGRTAEAIAIGEQVLADHERLLGPDHPNTLTARGNLDGMKEILRSRHAQRS